MPADAIARRSRHALWLGLALIVIWGANFSVQKAAFTYLQPGGFLFVRYLIMPLAAAALLCWSFGVHWPRVPRSDLWALVRLGLAGHLVHVGLVTYGIHWSTAFSSSLILACGPVFTLLILRWYGIEPLAAARWRASASPSSACWYSCPTSSPAANGAPAAATWCCSSRPRSSPTTPSRPNR